MGFWGPFLGPSPIPSWREEPRRAPARGAAQQIFIQHHFPGRSPATPPAGWAEAPHTRRATCGATAVPHGTSPPRNDFTGSPGRRRGVRPDQPKLSEGRSREGSRAPAPILLRAGEEGGRSPAALEEPSQTSAPASGLHGAQVAARKPEPGQPEHGGCQLESIPPGGMLLAAPSPAGGDHGLCSARLPAVPSWWQGTVPRVYSELDHEPCSTLRSQCQRLLPMNTVRAVPSSWGCKCCYHYGGMQRYLPFYPQKKNQGPKGHPQITAVPGSHKDFPRALKAPGDVHSLGDQLRSDACTPKALQRTQIISAPAATAARRRCLSSRPCSLPLCSPGPVLGDGRIGPSSTHALPEGQDESSLGVSMGFCHLGVFEQLQGWSQLVPICPWRPHLGSCPSHKHHLGAHS